MRFTRLVAVAVALATSVAGLAIVDAHASAACADPAAPGGEWRQYSHDLSNTRNQPDEDQIGPAQAANLAQEWSFTTEAGDLNNDPVVADGCVFLATSAGHVYALNADSGDVVWHTVLDDGVSSTPAVAGGKVYLHVNTGNAPKLVVLDESSGDELWRVTLSTEDTGTEILSSPKILGNLLFSGISGAGAESGNTFAETPLGPATGFSNPPDSRLHFRGIYTLTDLTTHEVVAHHTIPDDAFAQGFAGGGVWSSAAIDADEKYAYIGAGNPFNSHEYDTTNSILKIDIDPTRTSTYGTIVAHYHGTNDTYVDGVTYKPVCDAYTDVFTCETSDFDFGASPQLFTLNDGTKVVGDAQKSGVYHVANRDDMSGVWKQIEGGPFGWLGGEATASFDGSSIVVAGNAPGLLSSFAGDATGTRNWTVPIADALHFQSVTTANGVAYVVDSRGFLDIWETATGQQIAVKSMGSETNSPTSTGFSTGFSVSVARHTVYVPFGGTVVAYH